MEIGDYFWSTMLINSIKTTIPQTQEQQQDMAGPIFDGMLIYSAFTEDNNNNNNNNTNIHNVVSSSIIPNLRMQQGSLSSINSLSREYLVSVFEFKCCLR